MSAMDDTPVDTRPGDSPPVVNPPVVIPTGPSGPSSVSGPEGSSGPAPVLFYTDIVGVPNAGGRNGGGAYLSIFGEHFGSTPGTVSVGGHALGTALVWGENNAVARGIDRIVVQMTADAPTGLQDVTISVGGQTSNALQVRVLEQGNIFWVDRPGVGNACDTSSCTGCAVAPSGGTLAQPFAHLWQLGCKIQPGDVAYVLQGTHTTTHPSASNSVVALRAGSGALSAAGTISLPIAIAGDPLATAAVALETSGPGQSELGIAAYEPFLQRYSLANFTFRNLLVGVAIGGNGHRIVNNLFDGLAANDSVERRGMVWLQWALGDVEVLGNRFTTGGFVPAIRIEGQGSGFVNNTPLPITIAYNDVAGMQGAFSFVLPRAVEGDAADSAPAHHLRVFSNRISVLSAPHTAIQLGGVSGALTTRLSDAFVYNNLVTGVSGVTGIAYADNGTDNVIAYNTCINAGLDVSSTSPSKLTLSGNVVTGATGIVDVGVFVGGLGDNLFSGTFDADLRVLGGATVTSRLSSQPADYFGTARPATSNFGAVQ